MKPKGIGCGVRRPSVKMQILGDQGAMYRAPETALVCHLEWCVFLFIFLPAAEGPPAASVGSNARKIFIRTRLMNQCENLYHAHIFVVRIFEILLDAWHSPLMLGHKGLQDSPWSSQG
jgi:hypothetical protein